MRRIIRQRSSWRVQTLQYFEYLGSAPDSHVAWSVVAAIANIALALAGAFLAVKFFQYRSFVPRLFFALSIASLAFTLLGVFFGPAIEGAAGTGSSESIVGAPGIALLWAIYMLASVRARNTFTR